MARPDPPLSDEEVTAFHKMEYADINLRTGYTQRFTGQDRSCLILALYQKFGKNWFSPQDVASVAKRIFSLEQIRANRVIHTLARKGYAEQGALIDKAHGHYWRLTDKALDMVESETNICDMRRSHSCGDSKR